MAFRYSNAQTTTKTIAIIGSFALSTPVIAEESATIFHTTQAPIIDGKLDDPCWRSVKSITSFQRYLPSAGGAPEGNTTVTLLQDTENIYIGIKISDISYTPKARISPRENINDDDQIGIYIDTVGDARSGYIFYFNALGIQQDIRYSNGSWFLNWNTVYQSEGHVTKDGYEIEIAIPFRSLQYPETENPNWKMIVTRKIPDIGEKYSWPIIQRNHPRLFMQAAPIEGIKPPNLRANIQFQPSISTSVPIENGDQNYQIPADHEWKDSIRPSMDFRWGMTANSGLTATINPDFSQVEGDVRQLNLNQRFAFSYPEQRPFFLDKIGFFGDQSSSLYSRSINNPLYGVKLAGTEKNIDFGVLHALDRAPLASFNEAGTPGFRQEDVEDQWALNSFARIRIPVKGQGYLGFTGGEKRMIKDLQSDLSAPSGFSDILNIDSLIPFGDIWTLSGYSSTSYTGDQNDQLLGNASSFKLSRSPNIGWGGSLSSYFSTKDYRQELGFFTQSGNTGGSGSISYAKALGKSSFSTTSISGSHHKELSGNYVQKITATQDLILSGIHTFSLSVAPLKQGYQGFEIDGFLADIFWYSRPSSKLNYTLNFNTRSEIDYENLVPATVFQPSAEISLRPSYRLRIDSSLNNVWYTTKEFDTKTAQSIYNRISWQLTKEWGIRIIEQSSFLSTIDAPLHNGSLMFTWLKSPGTAAYFGTTYKFENNQFQEQIFFAKYTHLFWL